MVKAPVQRGFTITLKPIDSVEKVTTGHWKSCLPNKGDFLNKGQRPMTSKCLLLGESTIYVLAVDPCTFS